MSDAPPTARSFRRRWQARRQALLDWTRHHGAWSPGVRLLRNLSLPRKTWLVGGLFSLLLLLVAGQLAWLRWNEWRGAWFAAHGVQDLRALSGLERAAQDLSREAFRAETGSGPADLAAAFAAEAAAYRQLYDDLYDGIEVPTGLRHALAALAARRTDLLAHRDDAARPRPPGIVGPRIEASRLYADALRPVRAEFVAQWAAVVDIEVDTRMLREGLVGLGSDLTLRLHRLSGGGVLSYGPGDVGPARRLLGDRLAEARLVLALARPQLERARAVIPDQVSALDGRVAMIERLLEVGDRLSRLPADTDTPDETEAALDLDPTAFKRLANAAVEAAWELESLGMQALSTRLDARFARLSAGLAAQLLLLGLLVAISLYLAACLYLALAGGLRELCRQVDELGRGNLSIRPTGKGRDEIGQALTTLGRAAAHMSTLLEAVTQGVAAVSHASREVAQGNAGLSGRTAGIRTAIGGVAGRTQSFAEAMDRCGLAVGRAAEHMHTMRVEARLGHKSMQGLNGRMRTLQSRSREIGQVVDLVEAVAYQTRLLALNASVEAARAGAAGKGFAVVALEVRALATRSETASRRIRDIVGSSITEIEEGSLMTERLSESVGRTDREIAAVSAIIGEIVGLVRDGLQQSQDVLGIAREVEDAAGGNARLVEQLSDASAELRDHGDSLKRSVQHFVIG